MSRSDESRSKLLNDILRRATTDRAFRQRLLREPAEAIRDAFGARLPPNYRIRFIERSPDVDALIVLPDFEEGDELSDAELEDVAGGIRDDEMWAL